MASLAPVKEFAEKVLRIKQNQGWDATQKAFYAAFEVLPRGTLCSAVLNGEYNSKDYMEFARTALGAMSEERNRARALSDLFGYDDYQVPDTSKLAREAFLGYLYSHYDEETDTFAQGAIRGRSEPAKKGLHFNQVLKVLDDCNDLVGALRTAINAGAATKAVSEEFSDMMKQYREGANSVVDAVNLFHAFTLLPWVVQKSIVENPDNADIVDVLEKCGNSNGLGKFIFDAQVAKGDEVFKDAKVSELIEELKSVNRETAQKRDELRLCQRNYFNYITDKANKLSRDGFKHFNDAYAEVENSEDDQYLNLLRNKKTIAEDTFAEQPQKENEIKKDILHRLKESMLAQSSISEEEAMTWVKNHVIIDKDFDKNMADNKRLRHSATPPTTECAKKALADIYRLTNGKINRVQLQSFKDGRSCAHYNRKIELRDPNIGTIYHEAGHIFEFDNISYAIAGKHFIKSRAQGELKKLSELTHNPNYRDDEVAFPDNFIDPYVGKYYFNGTTEVLSMGLQIFGDINDIDDLSRDEEFYKFCFGCFIDKKNTSGISNYKIKENMNDTLEIYNDQIKKRDYEKAIDAAITTETRRKLLGGKSVEGFRLIEKDDAYIIKYERKTVYATTKDDLNRELRRIYLAICHIKGLFPDCDKNVFSRNSSSKYKYIGSTLLDVRMRPYDWFTPLTKKLPEI